MLHLCKMYNAPAVGRFCLEAQLDINLPLPQLHEKQLEVYRHPAQFKVVCAGRRSGKSELARTVCIIEALNKRRPILWGVPFHDNALQTWKNLIDTTRPLQKVRGYIIRKEERMIEFPGGGYVQIASLDNAESKLGGGYAGVVLDEAARIKDGGIWRESIMPMLADFNGWAYIISTPKQLNWFYDEYQRGVEGFMNAYAAFHFTTYDNPHVAKSGFIELMRGSMLEREFQQEIMAEFLNDATRVFRNVRECTDVSPNPDPQSGVSYVFGVDWGRSEDYTVVSIWDTQLRKEVYLDRFTGVAYTFQRDRLMGLFERYRPTLIVAEENAAGSTNIEELQKEGLPIVGLRMTNPEKIRLVRKMQLALERQDITLYPHEEVNGEMLAFDEEKLPSGMYRYGAPKGKHDDGVVARMLAVDQLGEQIGEVETWVW